MVIFYCFIPSPSHGYTCKSKHCPKKVHNGEVVMADPKPLAHDELHQMKGTLKCNSGNIVSYKNSDSLDVLDRPSVDVTCKNTDGSFEWVHGQKDEPVTCVPKGNCSEEMHKCSKHEVCMNGK